MSKMVTKPQKPNRNGYNFGECASNDKMLSDMIATMDKCSKSHDKTVWGCMRCPTFINCQALANSAIDRSIKRKLLNEDQLWFNQRWEILQRILNNHNGN